jgi:hypothetical protein
MTTLQRGNDAEVGVDVQAGENSLAANPEHAFPIVSGLPKPVQDGADIEVSDTTPLVTGFYKKKQWWEADLVWYALPRSLGHFIKGILPTLVTTGAGPYTHTFTPDTTGTYNTPPFLTLFSRRPGGPLFEKFGDGTVTDLEFNFSQGEMLQTHCKLMGYTPSVLGSTYTAGVTEAITSAGTYLTYVGATVKIEEDSQTPATTNGGYVQSGTLGFHRAVSLEQTTALNPSHRGVGKFSVGGNFDVLWYNYEAYRATYYGAVGGSASSLVPVFGSLDFLFQVGPTADATQTLQIQFPQTQLYLNEPPDSNTSGDPVHVAIDLKTSKPTSGSQATVILKTILPATY